MSDHHIIEEGEQEAAIGAFLLAHEGHTQDVEVQRGAWTVYCRCARCEDVRTYEADNGARGQALKEAMERALGTPLRMGSEELPLEEDPRRAIGRGEASGAELAQDEG